MTQKNLDKFSVLIAVVVTALTVSLMSLTGRLEHADTEVAPAADTVLSVPSDTTILVTADTLAIVEKADSLI